MNKSGKDIKMLGKWLVTKGYESILQIQKILFFIRYEELKSKNTQDSYFKKDHNFQAWKYGPVSVELLHFLNPWFNKLDEAENYIITDHDLIKEIDNKYLDYLKKYEDWSIDKLIDESHKNQSWINARKNYGIDDICKEYMEENENFLEFIRQ